MYYFGTVIRTRLYHKYLYHCPFSKVNLPFDFSVTKRALQFHHQSYENDIVCRYSAMNAI